MQMYTLHYNEFETPDKVKPLHFDAPLKKPDLIWIQMEILFLGSWWLFKSFCQFGLSGCIAMWPCIKSAFN